MPHPHLHLLPGLHGSAELFAPVFDAGAEWALSVCSYPGASATEDDVIRAIAGSAPDGSYVLVAESFSGPFAAKFAAERPKGLAGLVLVNTFLRMPWRPVAKMAARLPVWRPWCVVRRLLLNAVDDAELAARCRRVIDGLDASFVAARLRLLSRIDARSAADSVGVPTLVLRGSRDRLVGARHARSMARRVERCTVREVDGPHLLLQARPVRCLEVIGKWTIEQGV